MPNGENWQGDVLRDLRGTTGDPQGPPPPRHGAPQPGQQEHAAPQGQRQGQQVQQGQWAQQQGQPGGYGQPQPTPQAPYGQQAPHGQQAPYGQQPQAAHPGQVPQPAPAPESGYGYPPQQRAAYENAAPPAYTAPRHQPAQAGLPQQGARSPHAPDSRPVVDKGLVTTGRKPRHGQSLPSRAVRALRRTVSSSAAKEVAEITRIAEALQQPVTTGRQIAVTSIRGGAGKTTVAALLGTTYAHYRQDPVLVVEADPSLGSLPLRLGAETLRWTIGDLADIVEPQMSLLDVTGYLVQLPGNAWLLPGSQGQIGAMLGSKAYEGVMVSLRRYFVVTVVDCETLPAEVARVALSASQARVLTAPATLEGVTSTYAVLQWMQGLPKHVIAGTVVVLTELVPHSGLDLAEAAGKLRSTGVSVQVLPYDRHLAAGGLIRTGLLAHGTREAATRLAADVFQLSQKRH